MIRLGPRSTPPMVWAVEDDAIQLCWGNLPTGPVTARAGSVVAEIDHRGGPGSLDLDGLPADRTIGVDLSWAGGRTTLEATTLAVPPGEPLTRLATISDLHLGATTWGALRTMVDPSTHPDPHPYRCARAAIEEAVAWGAELLIIKGDAVEHECDEHFEILGHLVDEFPDLPMLLIPGNHDIDGRPGTIPATVGRRALPYVRNADHLDLPGLRVVVGDTTIPERGVGTLARVGSQIEERVADADRPVLVAIHQQLQTTRLPRYWPAGIPAPESTSFLDRLDAMAQPVVVSSGHTHRNRCRHHRSVLVTEVASTKDWPGVWAGYAIHRGGLRQVVRRIARADAITWTEYSRQALFGLWGHWSPGPIDQRCLGRPWSGDRSYA